MGTRKTARLDQILLTLGYADQEQITRGLARQRARGGRLGMNLVEMGAISVDQLLAALSEQYRLPATVPSQDDIPLELLRKIPREAVFDGLILPLAWNAQQKVLTLAVASPEQDAAIERVKEALGARAVRLQLAPDRLVVEIASNLLGSARKAGGTEAGVLLPELFQLEEEPQEEDTLPPEDGREPRRFLMVTEAAHRKNFLPPVFQREGVSLVVVSAPEEVEEALTDEPFEGVLLSQEMTEAFASWVREGRIPEPEGEVTVFHSLSGALLENPLPYEATVRSLKGAIQALADARCAALGASPPYGLIASDLEALAQRLRVRRVVTDGLQLAAHLLVPGPGGPAKDPVGNSQPFGAFASTLELASRIRFPWRLDRVLDACHALYSGRETPSTSGTWGKETRLAAQLLALVWYRHNHIAPAQGDAEEAMMALRTVIRERAGRLAPLEVVEAYLRLIADRGGALAGGADRQVLLVGGERISRALVQGLTRVGCQPVVTEELADAQTMAERRAPGAIILDREVFPSQVERFTRVAKLDTDSLFFVLTDSTDPSLVLNLLDIGVDDVFVPPHDFELMSARVNRAIRSRAKHRPGGRGGAGQFSATFEVFSFLDLVQALGQGRKTVRIELSRGTGDEEAEIFMENGRLSHATCGSHSGPEAVYRVIAWEDQGEFTVHTETELPDPNIRSSNESILMEGCRILDESRR